MGTHTIKYWHKTSDADLEPLAHNRAGLKIECAARELEWCATCKAAVKPEGELRADGIDNICPFCGDYVYPPK